MSFVHPTLLAVGLASVAIPLIIHFFLRKRRKPVRWAAMRFLLEAYRKHQRRRKLEQIVLLALRCLLIAALAIGIARPLFGALGKQGATTLVIVIDNGVVSGLVRDTETDLDRHLEEARELIADLDPGNGDRVAVITAAKPSRAVVQSPTLDHGSALRALDRIETRSSRSDLGGAIEIAHSLFDAKETPGNGRIAILSRWRSGSFGVSSELISREPRSPDALPENEEGLQPPVSVLTNRPASDHAPNLRIMSFAPGRGALFPSDAASARQALVTIERDGDDLAAVTVRAEIELIDSSGTPAGQTEVTLPLQAGERSGVYAVPLPSGTIDDSDAALRLTLSDTGAIDLVPGDSVAIQPLKLRSAAQIGIAHTRSGEGSVSGFDSADWLRAALNPDDATPIRLVEVSAAGLHLDDLVGLDAVFIAAPDLITDAGWGDLGRFRQQGGTIVLIPTSSRRVQQWTDRLADLAEFEGTAGLEAVLFEEPEPLSVGPLADALPMLSGELDDLASDVTVRSVLEIKGADESAVLKTESGNSVLMRLGQRVWVFSTALDPAWTDLPAKPLFVPLVQEIARRSAEPRDEASGVAGRALSPGFGAIELVRANDANPETPGGSTPERVSIGEGVSYLPDSGIWAARNARGETVSLISVTPDPEGGRTDPTPESDVMEWLGSAAPWAEASWLDDDNPLESDSRGTPNEDNGWIPFVIALALAGLELVIARRASHAGRASARAGSGAA